MIEVLAGDLKASHVSLFKGQIQALEASGGFFSIPKNNLYAIESIEVITEENKKKFASAAGWATIGTVAFGPLGGLAGIAFGGNKKEVCFACELVGGKRFMGKCSQADFKKLYVTSYTKASLLDAQATEQTFLKETQDEKITPKETKVTPEILAIVIGLGLGFLALLWFNIT